MNTNKNESVIYKSRGEHVSSAIADNTNTNAAKAREYTILANQEIKHVLLKIVDAAKKGDSSIRCKELTDLQIHHLLLRGFAIGRLIDSPMIEVSW